MRLRHHYFFVRNGQFNHLRHVALGNPKIALIFDKFKNFFREFKSFEEWVKLIFGSDSFQEHFEKYQWLKTEKEHVIKYLKKKLTWLRAEIEKGIVVKSDGPKKQIQAVSVVELSKATESCYKKSQNKKNLCKRRRIDICRDYLSKHTIKGKPDYTAEQLSNYCSKPRF